MRIDRLLYFLRFARSRALAQRWIAEGRIRRNGERVVRQDLAVAEGVVLTLPLRR
jgi:ribosome-associated heat shock protein Hsp15